MVEAVLAKLERIESLIAAAEPGLIYGRSSLLREFGRSLADRERAGGALALPRRVA